MDIDHAKNVSQLLYSSFLSAPNVVVLETSDNCVIQRIHSLDIFQDKIYILDDQSNKLLVFNMDGTFLYNIGHAGRGNGEYVELSDFSIDRQHGFVYLWDEAMDQALKYDVQSRQFVGKVHNERDGHRSYCMQ